MEILNRYIEYRKNKPLYAVWKNERNIQEAKRINYLKNNNINPQNCKSDIERAKAVLNAVDIMDEYSQARAEDMEMVLQSVKEAALQASGYVGLIPAGLCVIFSKKVRNAIELLVKEQKFSPRVLLPVLLSMIPTLAFAPLVSTYGAKTEVLASRLGRAEAINKKLNSPNQFAVLTDEQNKQVEEIAKGINITEKEAGKLNKTTGGFGIIKSLKTLFYGDKESEKKLKELYEKGKINLENIKNDKILSAQQIEEAKKDKQLIQNIVEKIDIASQDYAEDVELATDTLCGIALGSGGITGFLTKIILDKAKVSDKTSDLPLAF